MTPIGFIGLGNMGQAMALNLIKAGYKLRVYNRTADKAAPLVALGAESVSRPSEAAAKGSIVITMVTDDAALENIVRSEGFMERLGQGGLHLSMSTVSPATSRMLADFHDANGSHYVKRRFLVRLKRLPRENYGSASRDRRRQRNELGRFWMRWGKGFSISVKRSAQP